MANKYWASSLTGGTGGCLDGINPLDAEGNGTNLVAGDICKVEEEDMISTYILRDSPSAPEDVPDAILPDVNTGDWWWELVERIPQDEGMVTAILYGNIAGAF